MSPKITESEKIVLQGQFNTLVSDLIKAGLGRADGGHKVMVYARRRIGVADAISVTKEQWERFFRQVDGLRFDFPGLARHIGSLPMPHAAEPTPAFTAKDLELLHDAGISVQADSRVQARYWKDKV